MAWLLWLGLSLCVFGGLVFAIFFWLNISTPIQTRLPVAGAGMFVLGFVMMFIYAVVI